MIILLNALLGFVALEHLGFLVLEMFLWTGSVGQKVFHMSSEFAEQSASLAKNQGLYNGFLAAAIIYAFLVSSVEASYHLKLFALGCVVIAGIFGALTVSPRIFVMQSVPALLALFLLVRRGIAT